MNFTDSPAMQAQPGTFSAYMNGLFKPTDPELLFYLKYTRNGQFRYYIAKRENKYLANWIWYLAMPCFEYIVAHWLAD
jgi:CCR4-NOT transcriptional regulation complex NOT5 subunit